MTAGFLGLAHRGLPQKEWGCSKGRELRGIVRNFPCPPGWNLHSEVFAIRFETRALNDAPQAKLATRRNRIVPLRSRRGR
jgi:hypothetical protein